MAVRVDCRAEREIPICFTLNSGIPLIIDLRYANTEWQLIEFVYTKRLDDLTFFFETAESTVEGGDLLSHLTLEMRVGEHTCRVSARNCGGAVARCRLGPLLAALLGEEKIFAFFFADFDDTNFNEHLVTLSIESSTDPMPSDDWSVQRVNVDDGSICILPEVLALRSGFFCNLFFGDFRERRESQYSLKGTSRKEMDTLSHLVRNYNTPMGAIDWNVMVTLVDVADRFSIDLPAHLEAEMERSLKFDDLSLVKMSSLLKIIQIYARRRDDRDLLKLFLDRFAFVSCLSAFLTKYYYYFSPESGRRVTKRIYQLNAAAHRRPKILLQYATGNVVVEVPIEMYPQMQRMVDAYKGQLVHWSTNPRCTDARTRDYATPFIYRTPTVPYVHRTRSDGRDEVEVLGAIVIGAEVSRAEKDLVKYSVVTPPLYDK